MADKITMEYIDACLAKAMRGELGKDHKPPREYTDVSPIIAKGPAMKPQSIKRMDPAVQMQLEMNRLGIKSDDKRQFTVDLAGRLMYYGDDHRPRYVETGTMEPPGEGMRLPSALPDDKVTVSYPSGVVPPERAVETALRDGRALVEVPLTREPCENDEHCHGWQHAYDHPCCDCGAGGKPLPDDVCDGCYALKSECECEPDDPLESDAVRAYESSISEMYAEREAEGDE